MLRAVLIGREAHHGVRTAHSRSLADHLATPVPVVAWTVCGWHGRGVLWRRRWWRRAGPTPGGYADPGVDLVTADLTRWATEHVGLIVGVGALLVLVALTLLVVSLIAQGGMAGATADLATGLPQLVRPRLVDRAGIYSGATPASGCS